MSSLPEKRKRRKTSMEFVTVTCNHCGRKMHVQSKLVRKEMYCTLQCLEAATSLKNNNIYCTINCLETAIPSKIWAFQPGHSHLIFFTKLVINQEIILMKWWPQYDSAASSGAYSSSPNAFPSIIVRTLLSLKQWGHRRMNWVLVITAWNSCWQL